MHAKQVLYQLGYIPNNSSILKLLFVLKVRDLSSQVLWRTPLILASTWKAEAGRSLSSRPALVHGAPGQQTLHRETLSRTVSILPPQKENFKGSKLKDVLAAVCLISLEPCEVVLERKTPGVKRRECWEWWKTQFQKDHFLTLISQYPEMVRPKPDSYSYINPGVTNTSFPTPLGL